MKQPTANYVHGSTDNNKSINVDTASSIAAKRTIAVSYQEQGKGASRVVRAAVVGQQKVPGSNAPLMFAISLNIPISQETAVSDAVIMTLVSEVLVMASPSLPCNEDTSNDIASSLIQATKGVIEPEPFSV